MIKDSSHKEMGVGGLRGYERWMGRKMEMTSVDAGRRKTDDSGGCGTKMDGYTESTDEEGGID